MNCPINGVKITNCNFFVFFVDKNPLTFMYHNNTIELTKFEQMFLEANNGKE